MKVYKKMLNKKQLKNITAYLLKSKYQNKEGFYIGNKWIHGMRNINPQRELTKAGRLSYFAYMDNEPVKIYECYNDKHAHFIEQVSQQLKPHFPVCLYRINNFLIVEWVEGQPLSSKYVLKDKEILAKVAKMQAKLHNSELPQKEYECLGFDYIKDYLKERIYRYKGILPLDSTLDRCFEKIDDNIKSLPKDTFKISHPDLTFRNLILDRNNNLKIIDNELLNYNKYFCIDLFNTYRGFELEDRELLQKYLKHYIKYGGNLDLLIDYKDFFIAVWSIRLIGTFLQSGNIDKALQYSKEINLENISYNNFSVIKVTEDLFSRNFI